MPIEREQAVLSGLVEIEPLQRLGAIEYFISVPDDYWINVSFGEWEKIPRL